MHPRYTIARTCSRCLLDCITFAESELFNFEATLEDALSRELEDMEKQGIDGTAPTYNDLEAQRFTEFLEQMPEHMWGMEFAN